MLSVAVPDNISDIINKGQPDNFLIKPGSNIGQILTQRGGVNIISIVFILVGLVFLYRLITTGIAYMTSSGDVKKIQGINQQFINNFFGLLICVFSFLIINLISNVIGLTPTPAVSPTLDSGYTRN